MALLVGGFGWQFAVTNPLIATRVFGLGSAGFGLFGTCAAVGGIGGTYWSSHRKDPGPREFLAWAVVFGVAEGLAAVMPAAWLYDAAMVVTGATLQLFTVSATVYIQQATPATQRGLALSAYNAGFIGFVPAGAFAVAAIASTAGVRWALIGPGLVIATVAAVLLARGTILARGSTGDGTGSAGSTGSAASTGSTGSAASTGGSGSGGRVRGGGARLTRLRR
jgi:hypothetical protein